MSDTLLIRPLVQGDFDRWLPLWQGYNEFYGRSGTTALPSDVRSEEHTSELQSLMRISYAVFCLKKKKKNKYKKQTRRQTTVKELEMTQNQKSINRNKTNKYRTR